LKREQNAVVPAHSRQTTDIMFGPGQRNDGSSGLYSQASHYPARNVAYCRVYVRHA